LQQEQEHGNSNGKSQTSRRNETASFVENRPELELPDKY